MSINKEEKNASHPHHVEIATLSMPSSVAESGVQAGDGTKFILDAPNHVIEQLLESSNRQQQEQPCIEGVVDLGVVSRLIEGIDENEFVGMLHRHHEHEHAHHQDRITTSRAELVAGEGAPTATVQGTDDEEANGSDSQSSVSKVEGGERQPLLRPLSTIAGSDAKSQFSFSADPFVQTLTEVHHRHQATNTPGKNDENEAVDVTVVDTFGSTVASEISFGKKSSHHVNSGATISREAFLLSVPTGGNYSGLEGTRTGTEDTFVLALPEVEGQLREAANDQPVGTSSGIVGSFLRNSATSISETVDIIAMEMDHAFDPLPTDVQNVDLRVSVVPVLMGGEGEDEVRIDVVVDRQVPLVGYVILVSGLVALSSVGAALDLQKGVTAEMKILWRLSSTSLFFLWLCAKKLNKAEFGKFTWWNMLVDIPIAASNYAILNTTFAMALEMTSLVNAFILSNMASLLMIGAKLCLGHPVLFFEGLGALIGFAGALICAAAGGGADDVHEDHRVLQNDTSDIEDEIDVGQRAMIGNVLAFTASIAVAIYLTVAKSLRPKVDLVLFMFLIFTYATVFLFFWMAYSGQEYEFSFDPAIGVFGWVHRQADRLPLEIYIVVVCNGIGTMGYVAIMKYFDPVVVSMVMLMEPIIAAFIGSALGVDKLPGLITWAGDAVVMVGSIMVIWSGTRKTETIDATEAIQQDDNPETATGPGLTESHLMKSPRLMKSPLIVNSHHETDEMEFISVKRKPVMGSNGGDAGQRVVWSSMKK